MPEDYSAKLNPEQKMAVEHDKGPLLIVAGAGTGKTTVITQRIDYLIKKKKVKPEEILALTFTDKAAGEMEERVDFLLPFGYTDLWILTFHSFAEKILQQHALEIGIPNDFKLLNQTEQWMLVRQNLDKFNLDYYKPLGNPTKFIHALVKLFSRAKDEVIRPEDFLKYAEDLKLNADSDDYIQDFVTKDELKNLTKKERKELIAQEIVKNNEVANAYHVYQQLLLEHNSLDFGDLINYCLQLFQKRPKVLAKYRALFKYILVDEFQDTNYAQYELVKLLAAPQNNVTVVGDDDQCLPPNTLIKTQAGQKKIKDIKVGERVATAVGRGYLSYAPVTKVFKNKKTTQLITFKTAAGRQVKVTDNHKMFCFVPAIDDKKYHYVYVMHRQDLGWRLGVTVDLASRLRLERSADIILGLRTCFSEDEARFYETLYSLKYNIPTVCFQPRAGVAIQGKWLDKLYQQIDTEDNMKRLAGDLGIDFHNHHYSLAAVKRGSKTRIKINLEMCHRRYRSKYAKSHYLAQPKVLHLLSLETSDSQTIKKLKAAGFKLTRAKKGYRLRISNIDLQQLGRQALKLEKVTGGILEVSAKLGRENIQTRKSLVVPAKNVLVGHYLPVAAKKGVVYDRVISKVIDKAKTLTVYDLEVAGTHNFVAEGVVVHNSIYKFRGASVSNILEFKKDYPKAAEIFLTTNYRSTQNILDLSYKFIVQNNPNRLEVKLAKAGKKLSKKLKSSSKAKGEIRHLHFDKADDEIKGVLRQISELKEKDKQSSWNDFAILARTNDMANNFATTLSQTQIPYRFVASRGLYTKPVILDVLAYLRLLDNYHESNAVYRILNSPVVGLEHKTIVQLNYWARRKGYSLYTTLQQPATAKSDSDTAEKIQKFLGWVSKHSQLAKEKSVTQIIVAFLDDTGYREYLSVGNSVEIIQAANYLNQFYRKVVDFEQATEDRSVKNFLEFIDLELEAGETGSLQNDVESGPEALKVMTIHAAKGLEFKYVWIVGMVDRRFPIDNRPDPITIPDKLVKEMLPEGDVHTQEERRLMYVAMTRAKQALFMTSAADYGGARKKKLSKFLNELEGFGLKLDGKADTVEDSGFESMGDVGSQTKLSEEDLQSMIPARFSFSQLNSFINCPYHYWLDYILKIPQKGKDIFSFGTSIHSTLQQFFILVRQRSQAGQADMFVKKSADNKPKVSEKELLEIYKLKWIDDWYQSRNRHDEYKAQGEKMLKQFYQTYAKEMPIPKFLETPFNIHILSNGQNYSIVGKMDRIDPLDGGVEIIDYKTGQSKSSDSLSTDDKQQLLIYQMAAEEHLGEKVEQLTYYYLGDGTRASFVGKKKEIENLKKKIIDTIHRIENTKFPLGPEDCTCRNKDLRTL